MKKSKLLIIAGSLLLIVFIYGASSSEGVNNEIATCEFYKSVQNVKSLYGGYVPEYCE